MPGKNLVLKCFQPIKLQYFLIINISGKSQVILVIFHGVGLQAKVASEKVVVRLDDTRFAFHVIRLHDSLVINILGENQLISYFFMRAVSHQGRVASETTTFGWVWSVKLFVKLDCRINNFFEKNHLICYFFCMELVIKERLHPGLSLLVGSGQLCASGQIGFQDSLVINISRRKQFITLSGHCHFVSLFYLFLGIIYQTLQGSI